MPNINTISSWYKNSQIEYFTPFMKLWLAFNSWYQQFYRDLNNDRAIIDKIKNNSPIKDNFINQIQSESDNGSELRNNLMILIKEIRIEKIISSNGSLQDFSMTDIKPDFKNLTEREKKNFYVNNECMFLEPLEFVINSDMNKVFEETFEIIYQVRCLLVHGNLNIDSQRDKRLIKSSYIILDKIFSPIIM